MVRLALDVIAWALARDKIASTGQERGDVVALATRMKTTSCPTRSGSSAGAVLTTMRPVGTTQTY